MNTNNSFNVDPVSVIYTQTTYTGAQNTHKSGKLRIFPRFSRKKAKPAPAVVPYKTKEMPSEYGGVVYPLNYHNEKMYQQHQNSQVMYQTQPTTNSYQIEKYSMPFSNGNCATSQVYNSACESSEYISTSHNGIDPSQVEILNSIQQQNNSYYQDRPRFLFLKSCWLVDVSECECGK
ncbi:hypothetical protein DLAC_02383 [Tieghemostelium lacteum]|uniref:Uncharacterized protein n=1 Tax=Tieghemostelium lacteum TaxID=361077 RepID=A0A152A596_TIELA|nr:hypothetical protein DLAC_02383 [Tieghemostelium lacteum]|eukprot:KYR01261.1 hypothetical protein DLAC_02383 [Tieghemostelium lacteum]